MNALDKRNMDRWRAMKGVAEPWLASGNAVYVARQIVLHYRDYGCPPRDVPCFRPDGKPSMEADPNRLIGVCEDYGEAAGIANKHNAAIGHFLFDIWFEAEFCRAALAKSRTESGT